MALLSSVRALPVLLVRRVLAAFADKVRPRRGREPHPRQPRQAAEAHRRVGEKDDQGGQREGRGPEEVVSGERLISHGCPRFPRIIDD